MSKKALKYSDDLLKITINKLEKEVLKRHKLNRAWFIFWIITNIIWVLIK